METGTRPAGALLIAVVLLLAPILAGCVRSPGSSGSAPPSGPPDPATEEGSACQAVAPPRARAGARYAYDAQGTPSFWTIGGSPVVSWADVDPDGREDAKPLLLPDDSSIEIAIAETTFSTYDLYGDRPEAFRAVYWAHHPDHPRPLDFMEERIDSDDGTLIKKVAAHGNYDRGVSRQLQIFGRIKHAPLMFAPMAWDEPLEEEQNRTLRYPDGIDHTWGPEQPIGGPRSNLSLQVERVYKASGTCQADVIVSGVGPFGPFHATFAEDRSLPVRFAVNYGEDAHPGAEDFRMTLSTVEPGAGSRLPAYEGTTLANRSLPQAALEAGFLADRGGVFATDFDKALSEGRDNEQFRAWKANHEDARIVDVRHQAGHPNSTIADEWTIIWAAEDGEARGVSVTNKTRTLLGQSRVYETGFVQDMSDDTTYPDNGTPHVPLDVLVDLHRTVYGKEPETLWCEFDAGYCKIGTHEATHAPYSCDMHCDWNYDGSADPGLDVWTEKGWIVREQGYDPAALDRPAPR